MLRDKTRTPHRLAYGTHKKIKVTLIISQITSIMQKTFNLLSPTKSGGTFWIQWLVSGIREPSLLKLSEFR